MTVVLSMNRCASCGKFFRDQGDGATRCEKCVWRVPDAEIAYKTEEEANLDLSTYWRPLSLPEQGVKNVPRPGRPGSLNPPSQTVCT
jgi:tRNA(Ile2) C34 agmatinyltransferase TiaS